MSGKRLVLVVDREADLRELVSMNLRRAGFATAEAPDAGAAVRAAHELFPSLIVLDSAARDPGGEDSLETLRRDTSLREIPVILLIPGGKASGHAQDFDGGPGDCMSKPFSQRELVENVRRLIAAHAEPARDTTLRLGPFRIDHRALEVWMDENRLRLTFIEYRLFSLLASHRGEVVPREVIHREIWEQKGREEGRSMDTHIKRLRRKLGPHAGWLQTSRNSGYRLCPPASGSGTVPENGSVRTDRAGASSSFLPSPARSESSRPAA